MRPIPDAAAWARLGALFDTGIELAPELRSGWIASLAEDEPPLLLAWLSDMLAAADAGDDPGLSTHLPARTATGAGNAEAAPRSRTGAQAKTTALARSGVGAADEAGEGRAPGLDDGSPAPLEDAGVQGLDESPGTDAAPPPAPEAPVPPGPPPAVDAGPSDVSAAPPGDEVASAAGPPAQDSPAGTADPAPAPTTDAGPAQDSPAGDAEPAPAPATDAGPDHPEAEPRLAAPVLATGMHLGPWRLVGPMQSTDGRVAKWRARRIDAAASEPEFAVLVPWQWRPRVDLAGWLAHASTRARALAHPHIARIAATGVTDEGVPWIACELAEGQPIDRWCRDHALAVPERRALLEKALEAAAFAHGRLVLHGHVHPSQILLAPDGRLRFLNFGLAELLDLLDVPDATSAHGVAGPPARAYAAPEQVPAEPLPAPRSGIATSAAADVYALGLVAFEVLSGASPWQPRPPGKAVAPAPGSRHPLPSEYAGSARVRRALRGELDAIVAKATQSEPARRYPTAAELLDDVVRAGAHRPVDAVDGGFLYQIGCVARRHPRLASAAMVTGTVLVVALAALSWKAWIWTQERDQAEIARRGSEAVTRLLGGLLQEGAEPGAARDWPETLARAEAVARSSLKEQPAGLAAALALIGRLQAERGAFAEARNLLAEALPELKDATSRIEARCDEAWAQARQGDKPDEAEQQLRRVTENVTVRPPTRVLCLARLADLERRLGRARDAYQTTFTAWQAWDASDDKSVHLALLLARPMGPQAATLGRFHESQLWFEWSMKHLETLQRSNGATAIELREQWGEISLAAGDAERALKLADENLSALGGSAFPDDADPATAAPAGSFLAAAEPRIDLHRLGEARARLERAIALADAREDDATARQARCTMALAAVRERDAAAAERWLKAASTGPTGSPARRAPAPRPAESRANPGRGSAVSAAPAPRASEAVTVAAGAPGGAGALTHAALVGLAPPSAAEEAQRALQAAQRRAEHACRAAAIELALLQGRQTEALREADSLLSAGDELSPRLRAVVNLARGEATLAARQHDRALSAALQALQAARALHQSDVEDQKARPSFRSGQAALLVAEAQRANGDVDEANKNLAYAMQQLSATLPESHPWRRRAETARATLAVHAAKKP